MITHEEALVRLNAYAQEVEPKVISWRRTIHAHPELGNREFNTSKLVAEHLKGLGLEVKTQVAFTGVVGILRGTKPGPVVALRADMDALPVAEMVDLPFASKVTSKWNGEDVGVMHACGHDVHTSGLMGVAEVLSKFRSELHGTIKFIFQPAEEMPPQGEEGGAALMIQEGVLKNPDVDAIFGLHVTSVLPTNTIGYRSGPMMASGDIFEVDVVGRQTHGAFPWLGVDPIVASAHVVTAIQTIVSRRLDLTRSPVVVSAGTIRGGVRFNIIPNEVHVSGTVRMFDENMRNQFETILRDTCRSAAATVGATANVRVIRGYDVTRNDPELTKFSIPYLSRVAGKEKVMEIPLVLGAEDFSCYQNKVPGFFYFLGCTPPEKDLASVAANHSPLFFVDEKCLLVCVKSLSFLAISYLISHGGKKSNL